MNLNQSESESKSESRLELLDILLTVNESSRFVHKKKKIHSFIRLQHIPYRTEYTHTHKQPAPQKTNQRSIKWRMKSNIEYRISNIECIEYRIFYFILNL
jgi:hypothetical protein